MTTSNNKQTDIFSLFGLVDDHAEKQKKEREALAAEIKKKVATKPSKEQKTKKTVDVFTPDEETTIRYSGETFPITTYVTVEELVEGVLIKKKDDTERKPLDPELIRKRMEKDFPELVRDHTEMIYIKSKNIIVPTMKAKKKGNSTEVLSKDNTSLVPAKIPFSVLRDFISIAKLYGEIELEVHADVYYCFNKKSFFLDFPKQLVHRYFVEVIEDTQSIAERVVDAIKVLEVHSHHSMAPIPSAQDNASERMPGMLYAIVGKTQGYFPAITLRQFVSEEVGFISKDISKLFECPFYEVPQYFSTEQIVCEVEEA